MIRSAFRYIIVLAAVIALNTLIDPLQWKENVVAFVTSAAAILCFAVSFRKNWKDTP